MKKRQYTQDKDLQVSEKLNSIRITEDDIVEQNECCSHIGF